MFKKILFPVDLQHSAVANRAAKDVQSIAQQFGADIHVMSVMPGFSMPIVASYFPPDAKKKARKDLTDKLAKFVAKTFSGKVTTSVAEGRHWEEILKVSKKRKVDLIALPHRSHGKLDELFLGSCATKVAERATCSVLIFRQ